MGARGPGHVAALCAIARPTLGVVTRIGEAHTEFFGDVGAVALAKGELIAALPAGGVAVLNADDARVAAMAQRSAARVVRFGLGPGADITARDVTYDDLARPSFRLVTPEGEVAVSLGVHGHHQVMNALGAAAAALATGVSLEAVARGLGHVGAPAWRMAVERTGCGAVLVNDAYNANPTSVRAALETVAGLGGRRRVAVLGAMAELGEGSGDHHRSVAELAQALGIELLAYRTSDYGVAPLSSVDEVVSRLGGCGPGDVVLVKGSRAAGMEEVASALSAALAG